MEEAAYEPGLHEINKPEARIDTFGWDQDLIKQNRSASEWNQPDPAQYLSLKSQDRRLNSRSINDTPDRTNDSKPT